ncbi:hypothetical protein Vadar_015443 [Vaccinium darrowii]|uniref:Uncharacterized protein n=1 Tax=Vaccinium darrowii TaxID=229202 RepID=A0ACB7ZCF1_9ERIC|nr:hypothetical protein Vadar_015443 [Vaccinium darrowii]
MEAKGQVTAEKYAADISSIREAQVRISSFIHRTPVISSETLMLLLEGIYSLNVNVSRKAALSLAAKLRGIPAYIVVPKNAPKCKVENVKRYGGRVIWSEPNLRSREDMATKVLQETGAVLLHPYNDGRTISGQGTISLELLEQAPQLDTIIVPISGGGLISGVALAAKSINPAIRILAAEPMGANDAAQSKAAGRIITLPETNTIADGLRAFLGDLTCNCQLVVKNCQLFEDLVDDVITVEDKAIVEAMRLCYEILKVVVEPSGAIGLAAVLSDDFRNNPAWKDCSNVGIVLSGGNVDLDVLWGSFRK